VEGHGVTTDTDLWVRPSRPNAERDPDDPVKLARAIVTLMDTGRPRMARLLLDRLLPAIVDSLDLAWREGWASALMDVAREMERRQQQVEVKRKTVKTKPKPGTKGGLYKCPRAK
jgi:hypothetical protein